jgi:PAS domain S-box-containing protein
VLIDGETGELVEFNKRAHENLGFSREEFEKLKIPDFEVVEDAEKVARHIKKIIKEGSDSFETKHRTKGGEIRDIQVSTRAIFIRGKNFIHAIFRDITNRKRAEEQMKASLREKEVLLNEIHHRVRNNFQIISSLLDLTSMRIDNQHVRDLLSETRAKIHAMALVHTQLYEQGRFDRVDMGGHMRKLVDYLSHTYAGRRRSIHTMIEASDVYLEISQAIPCALVLSEIISNAFKHAFAETQKGTIEISAQRSADNTIFISVEDDGMGIPEEIDIYKANSLGLKLIRNIVEEQLMGKVRVERGKGTNISIEFKAL